MLISLYEVSIVVQCWVPPVGRAKLLVLSEADHEWLATIDEPNTSTPSR